MADVLLEFLFSRWGALVMSALFGGTVMWRGRLRQIDWPRVATLSLLAAASTTFLYDYWLIRNPPLGVKLERLEDRFDRWLSDAEINPKQLKNLSDDEIMRYEYDFLGATQYFQVNRNGAVRFYTNYQFDDHARWLASLDKNQRSYYEHQIRMWVAAEPLEHETHVIDGKSFSMRLYKSYANMDVLSEQDIMDAVLSLHQAGIEMTQRLAMQQAESRLSQCP